MAGKLETVLGSDLKPGDTIEVWWAPRRATIVSLEPYTHALAKEFLGGGARIASFAVGPGMTVGHGEQFQRVIPA